MPMTSISSDDSYATPQDFIDLVDVNYPGLLTRDDGGQNSATELLTDPKLAKALAVASGKVESVCLRSERYTPADLQALTGNSLAHLKAIVCGLAIQGLRGRRGIVETTTHWLYTEAVGDLNLLGAGEKIFAFEETAAAGLPRTVRMQANDFYSGLPTLLTNNSRYWGTRRDRRGLGSYGAF